MEIAPEQSSRRNALGTIREGVPGLQDDEVVTLAHRHSLFEDIGSGLPPARHSYADLRKVDCPYRTRLSNEAPAAYNAERRGIQSRKSSGLKKLIEARITARRNRRAQAALLSDSNERIPVSDELMKTGPFRALVLRARTWRRANLQVHCKHLCRNGKMCTPIGADSEPIEITIALTQSDVASTSASGVATDHSSVSIASVVVGKENLVTQKPKPTGCGCWRRGDGKGDSTKHFSSTKGAGDSFVSTTGTTKSAGPRVASHEFVICVKANEGNGIIGALGGEGLRGVPTDVVAAKAWLKMQLGVLRCEKTHSYSAVVFVHRHGAVCALDIDLKAALNELRTRIAAGACPTTPCRVPKSAVKLRCLFDSRRQPVLFDRNRNCMASASCTRRRSGLSIFRRSLKPPNLETAACVQERFLALALSPPNWSAESFLFMYGHDKYLT